MEKQAQEARAEHAESKNECHGKYLAARARQYATPLALRHTNEIAI